MRRSSVEIGVRRRCTGTTSLARGALLRIASTKHCSHARTHRQISTHDRSMADRQPRSERWLSVVCLPAMRAVRDCDRSCARAARRRSRPTPPTPSCFFVLLTILVQRIDVTVTTTTTCVPWRDRARARPNRRTTDSLCDAEDDCRIQHSVVCNWATSQHSQDKDD
jgi:hypothetical protein